MNGNINNSINIKPSIGGNSNLIAGIVGNNNLSGRLKTNTNTSSNLSNNSNINGSSISSGNIQYTTNLDNSSSFPNYNGSYDIIPRTEDQELETKNKVLRDDMLIEKIPYFETSNENGYTVYIG